MIAKSTPIFPWNRALDHLVDATMDQLRGQVVARLEQGAACAGRCLRDVDVRSRHVLAEIGGPAPYPLDTPLTDPIFVGVMVALVILPNLPETLLDG